MRNKKHLSKILTGITTGVTLFSLLSFEERLAEDATDDTTTQVDENSDQSVNNSLPVGTIKELKNITQKNLGQSPYRKNNNWADYDAVNTGLDANGNLLVAVEDTEKGSVFLSTYEKDTYTLLNTIELDHSSMPKFGSIYFTQDDYFYLMVGQDNEEKNDGKTVIEVRKYSYEGALEGTAEILGKEQISKPFNCANSAMEMEGDRLLVYSAATMYNGHQASRWFDVDTTNMTASATRWKQSHSFNQFLQFDNGNPFFLDHGDTYKRGIVLIDLEDNEKRTVLQEFDGEGNKTKATVNGFRMSEDNYIIQGTMASQNNRLINGTASDKKNAFLITADKNSVSPEFTWLTTYSDSDSNIVGEGRLVAIENDQYVYIFSEYEDQDETNPLFKYHLLNSKGEIVSSKEIKNMNFTGNSEPVVHDNNITWVSPDSSKGEATYLYQLDITDPENPVVSGAVTDDSNDDFTINGSTNKPGNSGGSGGSENSTSKPKPCS